jgi:hypothetical protein
MSMNINSFQTVNYTICIPLKRLNLSNAIVINIKPEKFSTSRVDIYQFSFQFLMITLFYSGVFEFKNRIPEF